MKGGLRFKILLGFLSIALLIFVSLGYSMYYMAKNEFFNQFRESKLSLARALALTIDGDLHLSFDEEDDAEREEFTDYLNYLRKARKDESFITYIYTYNFNQAKDEWTYAIDPYEITTDTIWLESELISLEIILDKEGKLAAKYNEKFYNTDFEADLKGTSLLIKFQLDGDKQAIWFGETKILTVTQEKPLVINSLGGVIDADNIEASSEFMVSDKLKLSLEYYFSGEGELSSYPGSSMSDTAEILKTMKRVFDSGKNYVDEVIRRTSYGEILSAYAPIKTTEGKTAGLLIIDVNAKEIREFESRLRNVALLVFSITFVITVIFAIFLSRYLTEPLVVLAGGVNELASGNYEVEVKIKRKDEIGHLAHHFNGMVSELRTVHSDLSQTNKAYSRFVPRQFLSHLGYDTIVKVNLGDQVQEEMTIMFQDIRSFTTLSEGMTPKENFDFINAFFGRLGPIIRDNNGFVDKYIGDAIMALFPSKPEDAVQAAIDMQKRVTRYNKRRVEVGFPPIRIGIGLHTGSLMLGTIGEEERMEGTVISDSVNVASRMEGLTKMFGASIIVSEKTLYGLEDPFAYKYRFLGKTKVKGKAQPFSVFEILDGDPDEIADPKLKSRELFERGVLTFFDKRFDEAIEIFSSILKDNPNDKAATLYVSQSEKYLRRRVALQKERASVAT